MEECTFNKYKYVWDKNAKGKNEIIKIVPDPNKECPRSLYKYYGLSPNSLDALEKSYLYASSSKEMNDIFDCHDDIVIDRSPSEEDLIRFFTGAGHKEDNIIKDIPFFKAIYPLAAEAHYNGGIGIVSLTNNIESKTMWAHYASSNHGFAVKFNVEKLQSDLIGPFPINYSGSWSKLNGVSDQIKFIIMTNLKSSDWCYEAEWRFLATRDGMSLPGNFDSDAIDKRKIGYELDAIEEIILGPKFISDIEKYSHRIAHTHLHILVTTPTARQAEEKRKLLKFIVKNKIKTSIMGKKEDNYLFEIANQPVKISMLDDFTFYMNEL